MHMATSRTLLEESDEYYTDSAFTLTNVPQELAGRHLGDAGKRRQYQC